MRKKKMEFMQKVLTLLGVFAILCTITSYTMAFLDKNPLEQLSIEVMRLAWGCEGVGIIGYTLQNCMRAKWFGEKVGEDK